MVFKLFVLALSIMVYTGCSLIEYHPYDIPISSKRKHINRDNIARILQNPDGNDTVKFVFMGDTQRWYDETVDFVKSVNKRSDIDFVVHGGDITDFGMAKEYLWIDGIMQKLTIPYVAIIGNHDILGQGKDMYQNLYGEYNFAFTYKGTRFLFLNTCALEYDYSVPIPDYGFIISQMKDTADNYQNSVFMMHVQPFDIEFNNNTAYYFQELIRRFRNPLFCVHAHMHRYMENEFFDDGIVYYGCDAIEARSYLVFTIVDNAYTCELVKF